MKKIFPILFIISIILSACQQKDFDDQKSQDHLIMSVLWYQRAAEMQAIYHQSFNWAKKRIDEAVKKGTKSKKAVVVDIDETMLDNSPFEGRAIQTGKGFSSETWEDWVNKVSAKALPGAVEFSKYAEAKNIEIFYISNRSNEYFDVTLKNLQKEGFAFADSSHLLLKTTTSSKKARRGKVKENYEIVLLIGDNMGDFNELFEDRSENYGFNLIEENKEKFGELFIVLPNPMYGAWEREVLDNNNGLTGQEKYELRNSKLIAY